MAKYQFDQKYNTENNREELSFNIPKEDFEAFVQKALKKISSETTIKGFRKGKAPEAQVLRAKYNEITDTAVNLAINQALASIENLEPMPLEQLQVGNISFNENNDLLLTLVYIPIPKVELGDLKKVKVDTKEPQKTNDEEIEKELQNIWFFYAKKTNPEAKKEEFSIDKINEDFFNTSGIKIDYPEVNNLEELKKFLENYINSTYEAQAKTSYENEIVEKVIKEANFEKVDGLVSKELDRRIENYKARFTSIGMNADDYMQKNNLSDSDLRKDWHEQAERDVKLELVLQKYGQENNIEPSAEDINQSIQGLDEQTKKMYANNPEGLKALVRYYYINQRAYNEIVEQVKVGLEKATRKENK